jgi:hypothetical protein
MKTRLAFDRGISVELFVISSNEIQIHCGGECWYAALHPHWYIPWRRRSVAAAVALAMTRFTELTAGVAVAERVAQESQRLVDRAMAELALSEPA